jgi:hypothetical protein
MYTFPACVYLGSLHLIMGGNPRCSISYNANEKGISQDTNT